jgi:hypothetical protein
MVDFQRAFVSPSHWRPERHVEVERSSLGKIAVNGFALLVVSIRIGTHILTLFGISLPVVEVCRAHDPVPASDFDGECHASYLLHDRTICCSVIDFHLCTPISETKTTVWQAASQFIQYLETARQVRSNRFFVDALGHSVPLTAHDENSTI